MAKAKFIIRADASATIGTGHIMRTLALAQVVKVDSSIQFLCSEITPNLVKLLNKESITIDFLPVLPGSEEDLNQTIQIAKTKQVDWIILDGYHFDESFINGLKRSGFRVLLFDDFANLDYYCADIILNRGTFVNKEMYTNIDKYSQLLIGPQFTTLRKEFLDWQGVKPRIKATPSNILISMGGADPNNVTLSVIKLLEKVNDFTMKVKVLLGPANKHKEYINANLAQFKLDLQIVEDDEDIPSLFNWADFAITAGGTTLFEMAYMGLPSIVIQIAENQKSAQILAERYHTCLYLGKDTSITLHDFKGALKKMEDPNVRKKMIVNGQNLIDGRGSERILEKLNLIKSDDFE
ncbi:UDP-2,4-diacetamido-2,4,6-trideoxy-beta-L-altropyranose hydrolase [Sediminibacillus halophilus]|uniref:UDP-2,4-diacetamido-2,4,6-trideoxy-beta-L-altropyranose hydrolase n=1 Tax=Sediminibacillus halophilus TaxID=482461 RepID=A0A1G9RBM7_9BACI|nr:UDP-2,4-diacetamido-2,4,6-trideoxy-beta-L-altropyranose hydrolase [Sediminibacillus halophilus]SDM20709.1 UDP-2,4-diacetamido-2,4,6-trideoxy-beta-L-altropyranose hydrolase [Sediminibacillus halophilus]